MSSRFTATELKKTTLTDPVRKMPDQIWQGWVD